MHDYIGRQIGHYRILRQLGAGTFATVYLAEHLYVERLAAIKILHISMGTETHRDFQEEARINAHLEHPHIIRMLDFGFYEEMPYLVMEYVEGVPIHAYASRLSLPDRLRLFLNV